LRITQNNVSLINLELVYSSFGRILKFIRDPHERMITRPGELHGSHSLLLRAYRTIKVINNLHNTARTSATARLCLYEISRGVALPFY
jgi:hypothetical protein